MWMPAGFVYLGVASALLVSWLRPTGEGDEQPVRDAPPLPLAGSGTAA